MYNIALLQTDATLRSRLQNRANCTLYSSVNPLISEPSWLYFPKSSFIEMFQVLRRSNPFPQMSDSTWEPSTGYMKLILKSFLGFEIRRNIGNFHKIVHWLHIYTLIRIFESTNYIFDGFFKVLIKIHWDVSHYLEWYFLGNYLEHCLWIFTVVVS